MPEHHNRLDPRPNSLIILYVKTRNSDGSKFIPTQENIAENVVLSDTSGDPGTAFVGNQGEYISNVKQGGTITWFGAVKDIDNGPRDFVIINGIALKSGSRRGITLPPSGTHQNVSYEQAQVTGPPDRPPYDNLTQYTIGFNVWWVDPLENGDHGYETAYYHIDPKLKIDPTDSTE